jgi:N4-gp56 family major capsid protein
MRDLFASSASYLDATAGINGDQPTELSFSDINNIERILLGGDARTMLSTMASTDMFGTAPLRDTFIALCHTDLTPDLQSIDEFTLKSVYPRQEGLRPEEYGSLSRFRFFVSSRGIREPNASLEGNAVYKVPMYGMEAVAKIEQNSYSSVLGYRPPHVVSSVSQNSQLYAKFAIGRAITNQNWLSGLRVTQNL